MTTTRTFRTKKESVTEEVRRRILTGEFAPGIQLRQDEIAARLAVSPTPVREALAVLTAEGLLESRPHRGFVVAKADIAVILDAVELRGVVEGKAARRAARLITTAELARLRTCLQAHVVASNAADTHAFRQAVSDFHEIILQAAGSRLFTDVVTMLNARLLPVLPLSRNTMAAIVRDHRRLLVLLRNGQGAASETLMIRHLHENKKRLTSHVSESSDSESASPIRSPELTSAT